MIVQVFLQVQRSRGGADVEVQKHKCRGRGGADVEVQKHKCRGICAGVGACTGAYAGAEVQIWRF